MGLAESNGSLPPGGWLKVTCGLTVCTPGSALGPVLGNEYMEKLYLYLLLTDLNLTGINTTEMNEIVGVCTRLWPRVDFSYQEIHSSSLHIWRGTAGEVNTGHVSFVCLCHLLLNCCSVKLCDISVLCIF